MRRSAGREQHSQPPTEHDAQIQQENSQFMLGLEAEQRQNARTHAAKATSAISCRLLRSSRQCTGWSGSINHICGTVVLVTVISDVRPGTGRTQKASPRWSVGSSPSGTASSDRVERQSTSSGTSAGASKAKRQCRAGLLPAGQGDARVSCSWSEHRR